MTYTHLPYVSLFLPRGSQRDRPQVDGPPVQGTSTVHVTEDVAWSGERATYGTDSRRTGIVDVGAKGTHKGGPIGGGRKKGWVSGGHMGQGARYCSFSGRPTIVCRGISKG